MSLKVHVHVKSGFCMIDTIGRIVEKGLIGSKRSIVVEIRLRRVAVSFAQQSIQISNGRQKESI